MQPTVITRLVLVITRHLLSDVVVLRVFLFRKGIFKDWVAKYSVAVFVIFKPIFITGSVTTCSNKHDRTQHKWLLEQDRLAAHDAHIYRHRFNDVLSVNKRTIQPIIDFFVDRMGFQVGTMLGKQPAFAMLCRDENSLMLACCPSNP